MMRLFTVCRRCALDVVRKEGRMKPLNESEWQAQPSTEPSPSDRIERREEASEVLDLVSGLPQNQQEVIRLKFQNGLSYQQIAEITTLSVSNVGFQLHTAIKTLRQRMQLKLAANQVRRTS